VKRHDLIRHLQHYESQYLGRMLAQSMDVNPEERERVTRRSSGWPPCGEARHPMLEPSASKGTRAVPGSGSTSNAAA
jgi:hypothetical protein